MDTVIVTPEKGRHKEIGQRLFALAENPRDVVWVTWPVAGFQVPWELFQRFHVSDNSGKSLGLEEGDQVAFPDPPKRRGRPRKHSEPVTTTGTDNTTSEEE